MSVIVQYPWEEGPVAELDEQGRLELAARAQAIAVVAHARQRDKAGRPYLAHIVGVAEGFDPVHATLECCAAWLHDVLEDTELTADDLLLAGIPEEVIEVVELLTRRPGEEGEYYARIAAHPVALAVKLADLENNTDPYRAARLAPATAARLRSKYQQAFAALGEPWPEWHPGGRAGRSEFGNPALYQLDDDDQDEKGDRP